MVVVLPDLSLRVQSTRIHMIHDFCTRNHNYGLGYRPCFWVVAGTLGVLQASWMNARRTWISSRATQHPKARHTEFLRKESQFLQRSKYINMCGFCFQKPGLSSIWWQKPQNIGPLDPVGMTWGMWVVPQIRGTILGDYSILGSILGPPILGNYHIPRLWSPRFWAGDVTQRNPTPSTKTVAQATPG